jgi:hypothetical protein
MRGRKRRKRKNRESPMLQLLMETSPRRDVEGDGDGSTLQPCLLLVPRPGVVSRSRHPVSPWLMLRATWAP